MQSIAYRLQQHIGELPRNVAQVLTRYCRSVPVRPPHRLPSIRQISTQPYWLAFPFALARNNTQPGYAATFPQTALHDILWAQYALYLSFRLMDDFLDRHIDDLKLADVPGTLQCAAREILGGIFPPSSKFWKYYHGCVLSTESSIRKGDRLQQQILPKPGRLFKEYAQTSAIFKIGSTAVCFATGKTKLIRPLLTASDRLAIGAQIVDDVRDIEEDLRRDRYNYAVQRLLKSSRTAGRIEERVFRQMLRPGVMEKVLDEAIEHFRAAGNILQRTGLTELRSIPLAQEQSVNNLRTHLHLLRVRFLFSPD